MNRILHNRKDDKISITYPAKEMTDDELTAHAEDLTRKHKHFLSHGFIKHEDIPTDFTFREAWADGARKPVKPIRSVLDVILFRPIPMTPPIHVDIPRAKEIHLATLKKKREDVLGDLDRIYLWSDEHRDNAIEREALKEQIIKIKKELREITKVQLPDTIEELKDFIPEQLKYRYKIPKNEK